MRRKNYSNGVRETARRNPMHDRWARIQHLSDPWERWICDAYTPDATWDEWLKVPIKEPQLRPLSKFDRMVAVSNVAMGRFAGAAKKDRLFGENIRELIEDFRCAWRETH